MTQFHKGQLVRCIDDAGVTTLELRQVYTVEDAAPSRYKTGVQEVRINDEWYAVRRFKIVDDSPSTDDTETTTSGYVQVKEEEEQRSDVPQHPPGSRMSRTRKDLGYSVFQQIGGFIAAIRVEGPNGKDLRWSDLNEEQQVLHLIERFELEELVDAYDQLTEQAQQSHSSVHCTRCGELERELRDVRALAKEAVEIGRDSADQLQQLQDRHKKVVQKVKEARRAYEGDYSDYNNAMIAAFDFVLDLLEPPQPQQKTVEEVISDVMHDSDARPADYVAALRSNPEAVRQLLGEGE